MKLPDQIVAEYRELAREINPMRQRQIELRDAYNGDVVIPMPELDKNEKAAVANLVATGLDQSAMRISSTIPDIYYPPLKPGQAKAEKDANTRRLANLAWWQMNKMNLKLRRRARHLIGYAMAPVILVPDTKRRIPKWQVRDPLTTFIPTTNDPDSLCPDQAIFSYTRPLSWLTQRYPVAARTLNLGPEPKLDDPFTIVEYHDAIQITLVVLGKADSSSAYQRSGTQLELLENVENRAGICLAVVPGRLTLDRLQGQFDGVLDMYYQQAKLAALETIAVAKGIFPDTYLVSRPNELAEFVEGPYDGRTGFVNRIRGGEVQQIATNPGFMTNPTIDRYERYQRVTAGIPSEFGGESGSNIRTGRRGESVLSAVVDFPIQEAQDILAESLYEENIRAIAIDKSFFDTPKSFYVNWRGSRVQVDYEPGKTFTTEEHTVRYAHAGADINSLAIAGGQRVGMGTMSKRTFMETDPLIEDPILEHERVIYEGLEQALLQSLQAEAQNPNGPLSQPDMARIAQLVVEDKSSLFNAVIQVHNEVQARQAAQAPAGAPEAQPGLLGPAQTPPGTEIQPPEANTADLGQLLRSLSAPGKVGARIAENTQGANTQGGIPAAQALR